MKIETKYNRGDLLYVYHEKKLYPALLTGDIWFEKEGGGVKYAVSFLNGSPFEDKRIPENRLINEAEARRIFKDEIIPTMEKEIFDILNSSIISFKSWYDIGFDEINRI